MAQDKAKDAPQVDLATAMKIVQQHVDEVASITGKRHAITFIGGKDGCEGCPLSGLKKAGAGGMLISANDLPPELRELLGGLFGHPGRHGHGGGH